MKNVLSTFNFYERVILDNLDLEPYDIEMGSNFENIKETYRIFLREKGYEIERVGEFNAFKDWLMGLPTILTVPFYNYDILEQYKKYKQQKDSAWDFHHEKQEDIFLENYWGNVAKAFFTLKDNL